MTNAPEFTKKYIASDKIVLDYGCGTGDLTIAIAENVKSVYAIDTSSGMIEVSKAKASQSGIRNVKTIDAASLFRCRKEERFRQLIKVWVGKPPNKISCN